MRLARLRANPHLKYKQYRLSEFKGSYQIGIITSLLLLIMEILDLVVEIHHISLAIPVAKVLFAGQARIYSEGTRWVRHATST